MRNFKAELTELRARMHALFNFNKFEEVEIVKEQIRTVRAEWSADIARNVANLSK